MTSARITKAALLALAYLAIAYATVVFGRAHGVAAVIWPANALALGALILLKRVDGWPEIVLIGAANALAHWMVGDGIPPSAALGLANGLSVGATGLLMRMGGISQDQPTRTRTVLGLFFVSVVGPIPAAVIGGLALTSAFNEGSDAIGRFIWSWWLLDSVNFLLLLPPFLFWRSREQRRAAAEFRRRSHTEPSTARRAIELAAASVTLTAAGLLVPITGQLWLIEVSATALLWFALRFGMFYTAATAAVFSVCVIAAALAGFWPGAPDHGHAEVLLSLQAMLALTTLPGLLVAAIASQRERSRRALFENATRLSYALEGANDGLWDWNLNSGESFFSQRACRMFGHGAEEFPGVAHWDSIMHEDDRGLAKAAFDAHVRGETEFYEAEVRCRHKDGHWVWVLDRGKVVERDAEGVALRAVGTYTDISERKRLESALEHLATHDALTGLANRAVFERDLEKARARLDRQGGRLAVLLIDVDHFKAVNDTFGHAAGDALLIAIGMRLKATARTGDVAARLGGDEFAVIAAGHSAAEFDALAERVNVALSEPFEGVGHSLRPTVSIGVAVATSGGEAGEELVARADRALYAAKSAGRGTWRFFGGVGKVVA
ncbi:MAG TPA: diguanylate cyclase [Hansschlegelia sp.]